MSKEIEQVYAVDISQVPDLAAVPYTDIEQIYFTPAGPEPRYPEVGAGEWRVRKAMDSRGRVSYSTTVKFGDKASGTRQEIEAEIAEGAFGTRWIDLANFGQAIVGKRRYRLADGLELDRFEASTSGPQWLAEREFASQAEAATWQPPAWCQPLKKVLSNRQLARPLAFVAPAEPRTTTAETISEVKQARQLGHKVLLTISGMSASGKSTVARQLSTELGASHIEADHFHIGQAALLKNHGALNHDLPGAYDYMQAAEAAGQLLAGYSAAVPRYDFVSSERLEQPHIMQPTDERIVVVEGLYAALAGFYAKEADPDLTVYNVLVNTPLHVCVLRRMIRDAAELPLANGSAKRAVAMTPEQTLGYLATYAIPTYLAHTPPAEQFDAVL